MEVLMKMRIKYIKDEPLAILKNNQKIVYNMIASSSNQNWIQQLLGDNYLAESKINIENLDFNMIEKNPIDSDLVNAKMIYTQMRNLNETQAIDERLWVGLALTSGYEYLLYRWGMDKETRFQYRWIFYTENRRKLFYHGLSRLWWFAHLSYDASLNNPFELTEFAFKNPQILENMIYRNISNSKIVRHSIIRAVMNFEKDGGRTNSFIFDKLFKEISLLGGICILDSFEDSELQKYVYTTLFRLQENM